MTTINGINEKSHNVPFTARYMEIHHPETFPPKMLNSIKNNKILDEFICSGNPITRWEKFINIFKKDEYLDIYYDKYAPSLHNIGEELVIDMGKCVKNNVWRSLRGLRIRAEQSVNNPVKKAPEERIIEEFEKITDFNKKISRNFDIIVV